VYVGIVTGCQQPRLDRHVCPLLGHDHRADAGVVTVDLFAHVPDALAAELVDP
jgi:hypothetical protein